MRFNDYLIAQITRHPSMQPRDIIKLCYQAAYGAEHLLSDMEAAKQYFNSEYRAVTADASKPLYEEISENVCRVNIDAWKAEKLPAEWLYRMFAASAFVSENPQGRKERMEEYIDVASQVLADCITGANSTSIAFNPDEWNAFLAQYRAFAMGAVHHSEEYRAKEHPAYRIIKSSYLRLIPILKKASECLGAGSMEETVPDEVICSEKLCRTDSSNHAHVIAIDGRAASGKSTTAALLETVLDAGVVHMDDFFLPPELRTNARLKTPGGNVHSERFEREILPFLKNSSAFSYRIFDCGEMAYNGERAVKASSWRIVEGSYSLHPDFGRYADVTVYSDVEPEEQMERIIKRDGEYMADMFRTRWIPLEEVYFERCQVKKGADIVLR